ncbi:hypothetical protein BDV98DRAFT_600384 [Pterulicium gracile]|uniref:Essential protein Yae1 N-terminal domain-containing protein n=1 Tax=Pterulicium gracile TaxID=1884261 RepID=A0A5C3QWG6_9AGAR|nr:hypothetical protein BDV98DRAFT_600384 [Pterula gracilis]
MDDDIDFDSLVNVEQTFYDTAYQEAYEHGRVHGAIEGRAMGREKGYEIWEELGFYEGFAQTWKAVYAIENREHDRAMHHLDHLLTLIANFPTSNPSPDVDMNQLTRQIRSRYKALCSTLGVRPSLRTGGQASPGGTNSSEGGAKTGRQVWKLEGDTRRPAEENQGINF